MNFAAVRAFYYFFRVCLALLGLFLIAASLIALLYPNLVNSETSSPSWKDNLLDVTFLVYGLLLLVPFRWLSRSPAFSVVLIVYALGVLWAAYGGLAGLVGVAQGRKSWHILPASAIFVILTMIAPLALIMRRRGWMSHR